MRKEKEVRNKWIHIRLNDTEYNKIKRFWKTSTTQDLSDYARTVLQNKPVVIRYRNASADEILAEMIKLKNELNAIGNNFNQAVHKLHTLDRFPEIRAWALQNSTIRDSLVSKVEEIKERMHQIYQTWLPR